MRKRRALVFDDDTVILNMLDTFLSRKGYEVLGLAEPVVCPVYMHTEDHCPSEKPCADVMLVDFQMPGMTGYELLKQQKEKGCRLDIKNKALMSGFIIGAEMKLEELGCAYFRKPFLLSELNVWIRACEDRIPLSVSVGAPRREKRDHVHIPAVCSLSSRSEQFSGVITNVSSSGFCLTTDRVLAKNDSLTVNAGPRISCSQAAVRWTRQLENSGSMAGCRCC